MATAEGVIAAIDQIIAFFNARKLDLPDGFLDRKAQFLINGEPFEALLGQNPNDALILMLTRGPAGLRFTTKGLQHAVTGARIERREVATQPSACRTTLRVRGQLRDSGEMIDEPVDVTLRFNANGLVETATAVMDPAVLEKIRQARRS